MDRNQPRAGAGAKNPGQFAAVRHDEAVVDPWDPGPSGEEPLRLRDAARHRDATIGDAHLLASPDMPFACRMGVASSVVPEHAAVAADDPDPAVRFTVLRAAGPSLPERIRERLAADPWVAQVAAALAATG